MLLAVDVGNTNAVAGLYRHDESLVHWRTLTRRARPADEMGMLFHDLFSFRNLRFDAVEAVVEACVVLHLIPAHSSIPR